MHHLLGELQKWVVDTLFKFSKLPEDVAGIIKIAERIEVDGPKMKSSDSSQQSGLSKNGSRGKERKKFGSSNRHKRQVDGTTYNKGGNHIGKPPKGGNKGGDMKDKRCHKCDKIGHFVADCPDNKVSTKASHVCTVDQMLEGGFIAKASSLKPRPSLLYLEAQINGKNVSCLVDTGTMHSFMSPKLARELGLPIWRAGKPIKVWFTKGKPHETKEVALHVNLKNGALEFVESFTLCEMDEVDLILGNTFFEAHTLDVRHKLVRLMVCHDGKEVTLQLTRTPMAGGGKLNLVSMEQMQDKQLVVVVRMEQMEGTRGEARKDAIQGTFERCWASSRMYSPISYPKSYHQREKLITRSR